MITQTKHDGVSKEQQVPGQKYEDKIGICKEWI